MEDIKRFDLDEELRVKDSDIFDKKEIYKDEIEPLIKKIKSVCARERLPFMFSIAVNNSKRKTQYINDGIYTGSLDMNHFDNFFEKMLLLLCGGTVTAKGVKTEFTDEDETKMFELLTSEEFMDPDMDEEEDELTALFDSYDEDIVEKAETAIATKRIETPAESASLLDNLTFEEI